MTATAPGPAAAPAGQTGAVGVLVNPTAGRGRGARDVAAVVATLRSAGLDVTELHATGPVEASAAVATAVAGGLAALVAVGGDGTVHLAAQAVAGTATALGIIPAGTGNDLAAALGVPADPVRAAAEIVRRLVGGDTVRIDAVRTTGPDGRSYGWWACVLAAGFDSAVNERANRMRWPRGPRRYDVAILAELARLRPLDFRLSLDGVTHDLRGTLVAVGNTDSYGGALRMCPAADPTDGLLDVTVVGPVTRRELIRVKPRVYTGTHVDHPLVTTYRAAEVRIDAPGVTAYADGERLGPLPLTLTCVPGALTVLAAGQRS
ncbi:MAG TPA: diacylglycerol kinase [Mycobacteriales bacterium]|nr:diacylglycerol kinase [Mycobacteriales bacterium]